MTKKRYNNKNFIIEVTDEVIIPNTGIGLLSTILRSTHFLERMNQLTVPSPHQKYANSDCLLSYLGLLFQGTNAFEEIDFHRNNPSYSYLLGVEAIPSKEILRQRFDTLGKMKTYTPMIQKTIVEALRNSNVEILALTEVLPSQILYDENGRVRKVEKSDMIQLSKPRIPIDVDVSPFDNSNTKKEGVSLTYKKFVGYSPNFMYMGLEGYLINTELREGKDHVQKGTPEFLRKGLQLAQDITDRPLCLRMDAGNDSKENMDICKETQVDYIIKKNFRGTNPEDYYKLAKGPNVQATKVREGKMIYDFFHEVQRDGQWYKQACRVTERTTKADGQILLMPEEELEVYWTTLDETVECVIALYHNHAVCEQFHSEIKTDLDSERLPSGKFETNQLVLQLTALAYNLLRIAGQIYLGHSKKNSGKKDNRSRIRMKSILKHIVYIASKLVTSGRQTIIKISRYTAELKAFCHLNSVLQLE